MEGMILHRGGHEIQRQELDLIQVPQETDSYVPVSHYHLTDKILTISQDILKDYTLVGEKYAIARQGNQMFAYLKFKQDEDDIGLSVAYRNSYDRSMSLGLAIGGCVFVCDNLSITGDIAIMKKHTKNVWNSLEDLVIAHLYKASKKFQEVKADSEQMKAIPFTDELAFSLMGIMYGNNVISPRQITTVRGEWLKPQHEEFQARTAWSFYNATTEALKSTPPISIMEKHAKAHEHMLKFIQ